MLQRTSIVVLFLCCFSGCHQNEDRVARDQINTTIAMDPEVYFGERQAAALTLNEEDTKKLRDALLARLPGGFDVKTAGDLDVLAVIGDEATANEIEKMALKYEPRFKIGSVFHLVIQNIRDRKRLGAPNMFPQEDPSP